MAIVLDAMGSETYPDPEIHAAVDASRILHEEIVLVGNRDLIESKLKQLNTQNLPVRIEHAPDILEMSDKAVEGARKKPSNSMAVGIQMLKAGQAQAFVTAGNTGGAMFNSLRILGRIPGVARPALTGLFPVRGGRCVVLDIGANADVRPEYLAQFAIMGHLYAQKVLNLPQPKIGLLSNGEEAGKGNQLVKEAFPLLEALGLNFMGNIEPKGVYAGLADVVITDGFTGNIFLKSSEAVAKFMTDVLRQSLTASLPTKAGALLAKPAFSHLKKIMDPGEFGAAPLLGVDGLVFVGHGSSNAYALVNALKVAKQAVQANLLDTLRASIQEHLSRTQNQE